jgi:surface polysaccharide O-acyltransferase-like enzyme
MGNSPVLSVKKSADRSSNLELLRIISMLLIVMHHYSVHGFQFLDNTVTTNKIIVQIISLGGKLGVNLFVLITGYFMIYSSFKIRKLIILVLEVLFYSIVYFVVLKNLGLLEVNRRIIQRSFFPITFNNYWFATTYVIMYLFIPFINSFIRGLTQRDHLKLIGILIIIWSVLPTFTFSEASLEFSNLGWFITLYLIASYIRLHPNSYFRACKSNILIALLTYGIIILSVIVFDKLGLKKDFFAKNATYFLGMNTLPILICSITLFLGFKNLKMNNVTLINRIALSMFGVYLLHDNYFIRPVLWGKIFKNSQYLNSPYLIIHAATTILIVFCTCIVIDQMRIYLIEKPFVSFLDKRQNAVSSVMNRIKGKILKAAAKLDIDKEEQ